MADIVLALAHEPRTGWSWCYDDGGSIRAGTVHAQPGTGYPEMAAITPMVRPLVSTGEQLGVVFELTADAAFTDEVAGAVLQALADVGLELDDPTYLWRHRITEAIMKNRTVSDIDGAALIELAAERCTTTITTIGQAVAVLLARPPVGVWGVLEQSRSSPAQPREHRVRVPVLLTVTVARGDRELGAAGRAELHALVRAVLKRRLARKAKGEPQLTRIMPGE